VRSSAATGRSFKTEAITTSDNSKYWVTELANTWLNEFAAIGNTGITYTWWAEQQTPDVQSLLGPPLWSLSPVPTLPASCWVSQS